MLTDNDITGKYRSYSVFKARRLEMAISNIMTRSLISAGNSIKTARMQNGIQKQLDDRAGVLEAEISQEKGNAPEKQKELLKTEEKAAKVGEATMTTLSDTNKTITEGAKEDQRSSADEKDTSKKNEGKSGTGLKTGVVYEKGINTGDTIYSINKMSQADRTAIVNQMKAAAEERKNQMMDLVQKTLSGQVSSFGKASGDDFWRTLAAGKVTVDAATRAQAQKDIGEDGYWGVKQTSQRLFDFASALAGDDVHKMKDMQKAMEKGFKMATKTWGRELPEISRNTLDAANKLFEDYYASKQTEGSVSS